MSTVPDMRQRCFNFIGLGCFLLATSICSAQERERLVWPLPPEEPRIEFLFTISSRADLGIERSFLRKAWDWFVGAEEVGGFLVQPLGVTVDERGRIYVTDTGLRCVHIFDVKNKKYQTLQETKKGQLLSPVAVAVSSNRRIYVTDSGRREVIVYDDDADVLFTISGYFTRPTGLTIHNNRLYVVDTGLHKIFVFDLAGKLLFEFGRRGVQPGEFNFPVFITSSQRLYVVDAMNHRVQVLDDSGRVIRMFGEVGNVQGTFANPKGIAVNSEGHIYVADALFDAFQIFDNEGRLLLVVGHSGHGNGEFLTPSGMAIDKENKIYVVDALNKRVQVFRYLEEQR